MLKRICLSLLLMGHFTASAMEEKDNFESPNSSLTTKNQHLLNQNVDDKENNLSPSKPQTSSPAEQQINDEEEDFENTLYGILLFLIPYIFADWK